MNTVEEARIGKLQGKAADLWAGLRALAAITAKMAVESDRPTAEHTEQSKARYQEMGFYWGDDVNAAQRLAENLADSAEELACALDYMNIGKRGEAA